MKNYDLWRIDRAPSISYGPYWDGVYDNAYSGRNYE